MIFILSMWTTCSKHQADRRQSNASTAVDVLKAFVRKLVPHGHTLKSIGALKQSDGSISLRALHGTVALSRLHVRFARHKPSDRYSMAAFESTIDNDEARRELDAVVGQRQSILLCRKLRRTVECVCHVNLRWDITFLT